MGQASFFSVAKVTLAHLGNFEAPEHRATLLNPYPLNNFISTFKSLSHTLPEVAPEMTSLDRKWSKSDIVNANWMLLMQF